MRGLLQSTALAIATLSHSVQVVSAATCGKWSGGINGISAGPSKNCCINIKAAIKVMADSDDSTYNGDGYQLQQSFPAHESGNSLVYRGFGDIMDQCIKKGYQTGSYDYEGQWYYVYVNAGCNDNDGDNPCGTDF